MLALFDQYDALRSGVLALTRLVSPPQDLLYDIGLLYFRSQGWTAVVQQRVLQLLFRPSFSSKAIPTR